MSDVTVRLTKNVALAILTDIMQEKTGPAYASNKGWSWWAYDASKTLEYPFGSGTVSVVQGPDAEKWEKDEGDTEVVFRFLLDDSEEEVYFRVQGEYTSYNGDTWNEGTFRQVRPTAVVRRVFEAL